MRKAVLRPDETLQELAGQEQPGAFAVGAFEDERLVGVGMVAADGDAGEWRVRGMAVLPEVRRRGAGGAILAALVEHAREQGAAAVWANVRTPARSLYERAGWRVVSQEFELPRIGPHVVMRRDL